MRQPTLALASLLFFFLASPAAFAQAPTPPLDAPPTTPVVLPPAPTIDDPMLVPVPPAQKLIATWEETLDLIRNRSTDLRTSYDEVLRAEGLVRTALAGMLPTINGTGTYAHQIAQTAESLPPAFAQFPNPFTTPNDQI